MRTVKRITRTANVGKMHKLDALLTAYNKEKDRWLLYLQQNLYLTKSYRYIRDNHVNYFYDTDLPARIWKIALDDACQTMHRYWCSIFEKVRTDVAKNKNLDKTQQHYANYILCDNVDLYSRIDEVLNKQIVAFHKCDNKKPVINYLLRKIKQYRGKYPRVKISRSILLDSCMYDVKTIDNKQFISFMSLEKGKRIKLPLLGLEKQGRDSKNWGTIRIVKDKNIEIHHTYDLKKSIIIENDVIGVDTGYTEVFVDSNGKFYGKGFGDALSNYSTELNTKQKARNKLYQIACKKSKKRKNIHKYNLGKVKHNNRLHKFHATCDRLINESINKLSDQDCMIVTENLKHRFKKNNYRSVNRKLSMWVKGRISERLEYKALAKGFSHKTVNAAYTSQTCPSCLNLNRQNRRADVFKCLNCGHEEHSDVVAAKNISSRAFDNEINLYTPVNQVKQILLDRFNRALEASATVQHRTLDTSRLVNR